MVKQEERFKLATVGMGRKGEYGRRGWAVTRLSMARGGGRYSVLRFMGMQDTNNAEFEVRWADRKQVPWPSNCSLV
jgi:hypothetical protein